MAPIGHRGKFVNFIVFFDVFGPWKTWPGMAGHKWGREGLFLANPDIADILGIMDLDCESFHV